MLSTVSEYFQGLAAFTTIYINSPLSDGRANANRRSCTGQDVLMLKWTFCFHGLSTFCGYRKKKKYRLWCCRVCIWANTQWITVITVKQTPSWAVGGCWCQGWHHVGGGLLGDLISLGFIIWWLWGRKGLHLHTFSSTLRIGHTETTLGCFCLFTRALWTSN